MFGVRNVSGRKIRLQPHPNDFARSNVVLSRDACDFAPLGIRRIPWAPFPQKLPLSDFLGY